MHKSSPTYNPNPKYKQALVLVLGLTLIQTVEPALDLTRNKNLIQTWPRLPQL